MAAVPTLLQTWFWREKHKRRELQNASDAQVTQSFVAAVSQLNGKEITAQLGGVYALERIAKDSVADRGVIVELLSAFVRENSWHPEESDDPDEEERFASTSVVAAVTVLGRLPRPGLGRRANRFSGTRISLIS